MGYVRGLRTQYCWRWDLRTIRCPMSIACTKGPKENSKFTLDAIPNKESRRWKAPAYSTDVISTYFAMQFRINERQVVRSCASNSTTYYSVGWEDVNGKISPLRCLSLPAPKAVLELVKCGCYPTKGECKGNCSCHKNELPCTPLCNCYSAGCKNFVPIKYTRNSEDVEEENENFFWLCWYFVNSVWKSLNHLKRCLFLLVHFLSWRLYGI